VGKELLRLKPLEMLDLRKCNTVADIIDGMSRCSFGARMLGEAAQKLAGWCAEPKKPCLIYDGRQHSQVDFLLSDWVKRGWFERLVSPSRSWNWPVMLEGRNALVVGGLSECHHDYLFLRPDGTTVYLNQFGFVKPGQVKDGFFPDAVFADPRYILPLLNSYLQEKLNGDGETVRHLLTSFPLTHMGGVAESFVRGAATVKAMMEDPGCFRFLTLSGAMTVAQMSLVICDLIDLGMVHAVVSTGALMAHGLVPGLGLKHYKYDPADDDRKLASLALNRVTDTLEPEENFDHIDEIMTQVLDRFSGEETISPTRLHAAIGRHLDEHYPDQRAILKSAYKKLVQVFVPAFTDSELGNDVYVANTERLLQGRKPIVMDMERDTQYLIEIMTSATSAGIMTWGGGVPRNWTQNVSPLLEIYNERLAERFPEARLPVKKFKYGCRVCPDMPHYGHLSGCTYEEGKSWRKFHHDGMFAEIQADSTQVWPFLVKYLMDLKK
jgi:deoxyhypusine synthase